MREPVTRRLLRELIRDVPGGRWRLAVSVLLASLAAGASVALMGVSAWLLSRAAERPVFHALAVAAVGVRFFGVSRGVFRYLERLLGHDVALRLQAALRLRTYTTLAKTTLIGRRRGDLLVRVIADVEAILDLVVRVIIPFASALIVVVATSAILGFFSPGSAMVLFLTAIAAGVVLPWFAQRLSLAADAEAVPARGRLADELHQLSRASSDIAAYQAEGDYLNRVLDADERLRRIELRSAWVRGLASGGQVVAAGVAVIAALAIGGPEVSSGRLAPVMLAVLVLTPLAMHEVLATFAQAAQTHTRAKAALERLAAVLDAPPVGSGDADQTPAARPGLELTKVTVGWPGGEPVVRDFSLCVQPGERVALVGASGSGKTTIAATIMGLIPPLAGRIDTSGRVGYLAQDAHIFATTLAENVKVGNREASGDQIVAALAKAGLDLDPERVVGESGSTLSGGEARRLALARVLAGERDLWILDEPTEHLDHETASALMSDVWANAGDQPVLVITHDPDIVAACDRVVRLT